uniref:Chromo domain-containing protein n=1 Tax=Peronospora matthiolae TaxID=2874970 RepID=A0AAV1TUD7_9STRA
MPIPFVSPVILQLFRKTVQLLNIKLIRPSSWIGCSAATTSFDGDCGGQRFLLGRNLNHRDVKGVRKSYLVRWCGYPPAWDSWEPRAQLINDVLGLIEQYDETHPLHLKKGRRKRPHRTRVQGLQSVNPFGHLRRDARPPVWVITKVGLRRGTFEFSRQPGHGSPR